MGEDYRRDGHGDHHRRAQGRQQAEEADLVPEPVPDRHQPRHKEPEVVGGPGAELQGQRQEELEGEGGEAAEADGWGRARPPLPRGGQYRGAPGRVSALSGAE